MNVYVGKTKIRLDPSLSIGQGGEADVYDIGEGRALKLFKPPTHPDFAGDPVGQRAAFERIEEHQRKLRVFPANVPPRVVSPLDLATTRDGRQVLGYTMRLLRGAEHLRRYGERSFRQLGSVADLVALLFRDLHSTLAALHAAGVVIGDFNDLNVLVLGHEAHLIDADSFQFAPFRCRLFSERFVDPLLCDPLAPRPLLVRPHNEDSDWYAYTVMLMRTLLFVDPYGGVFKPTARPDHVAPAARPLRRISVFHPEVRYPKPALSPDVLPDDILQHLHLVFERDRRGAFPVALLDGLRITRCTTCGAEHARALCPRCQSPPPSAVRETTTFRGEVRSTPVFRTHGEILYATMESGGLRLLVRHNRRLSREDGGTVLSGEPQPGMRFGLSGARTVVACGAHVALLAPGAAPTSLPVDRLGTWPLFDANERHVFWVDTGRLMRDGPIGPERIGDVLRGQTRFWVGRLFGLGFYRAGDLCVSFVFETEGHAINDSVKLPPLAGQLVEATAVFTDERCWLLTSTQAGGRTVNRCVVVRRNGSVEAVTEAEPGDGSWLAEIHGRCAAGSFLLAPTDDGVLRVEACGGQLSKTKEYPDTAPFVDAGCRLLAGPDGVYVVDRQEVRRLRIG
jgi:hypothetical protein